MRMCCVPGFWPKPDPCTTSTCFCFSKIGDKRQIVFGNIEDGMRIERALAARPGSPAACAWPNRRSICARRRSFSSITGIWSCGPSSAGLIAC